MQKITHSYAITVTLISLTSYGMPVSAQPLVMQVPNSLGVHFVQQPELPDNGTPTGRRKGAAGRGNCTLDQSLTALVPAVEKTLPGGAKVTYVWGKTIADRPTFWFYVPYSPESLRSIEFVLQDGENDIYRTPVKLTELPGILSVRLPSTATPLEIGKMYHWFFKINLDCDSQQPSVVKDYLEGWVQRVTLNSNLASQLETATPQQRIALYAKNGIWHEALTAIADLRLIDPKDVMLKNDWANLLKSVGLSDIASKPLEQCCNLNNAYSFEEIRNLNP